MKAGMAHQFTGQAIRATETGNVEQCGLRRVLALCLKSSFEVLHPNQGSI